MSKTVWVFSNPVAPHLSVLDRLPEATDLLIGNDESFFKSKDAPDCVLNCTGNATLIRALWPQVSKAKWIHSMYAGVENMLTPELRASEIPVTNARGVFKRSLGEFVIAASLFFAKDLRRMLKQQKAETWEPFDIEELHGKTMAIVGYGEIGRSTAERAKVFGMKILALRRRPEQSANDPLVDESHPFTALQELLPRCDYVVCCAPQTPQTVGLFDEPQFRAMKKTAVFINVGRGTIAKEPALIRALQEGWIRGAALDVFEKEPLPKGHAFYQLQDNVLLSPHCADHTTTWLQEAIEFFVENFRRFENGAPLQNVVDKEAGY